MSERERSRLWYLERKKRSRQSMQAAATSVFFWFCFILFVMGTWRAPKKKMTNIIQITFKQFVQLCINEEWRERKPRWDGGIRIIMAILNDEESFFFSFTLTVRLADKFYDQMKKKEENICKHIKNVNKPLKLLKIMKNLP